MRNAAARVWQGLFSTLPRRVGSETLDHLDEDDPRAMRSRRDLQRVHKVMRTRGLLLTALQQASALAALKNGRDAATPLRILELGAGDATLMLDTARHLAGRWPHVQLTLLDRQIVVSQDTLQAFRKLGWQVEVLVIDVMDWIAEPAATHWDIVLANLFMHHFDDAALSRLLANIAARAGAFVACEPRRSRFALLGSHLIGALGANDVTREDAVLSVHAGFVEHELSALWRQPGAWQLIEYGAGLFSHCFIAVNLGARRP